MSKAKHCKSKSVTTAKPKAAAKPKQSRNHNVSKPEPRRQPEHDVNHNATKTKPQGEPGQQAAAQHGEPISTPGEMRNKKTTNNPAQAPKH